MDTHNSVNNTVRYLMLVHQEILVYRSLDKLFHIKYKGFILFSHWRESKKKRKHAQWKLRPNYLCILFLMAHTNTYSIHAGHPPTLLFACLFNETRAAPGFRTPKPVECESPLTIMCVDLTIFSPLLGSGRVSQALQGFSCRPHTISDTNFLC